MKVGQMNKKGMGQVWLYSKQFGEVVLHIRNIHCKYTHSNKQGLKSKLLSILESCTFPTVETSILWAVKTYSSLEQ